MRYRLRTLLIALALGPPVLAFLWLEANGIETAGSIVGEIVIGALLLGLACAAVLLSLGYR